jgi:hypothetical protein
MHQYSKYSKYILNSLKFHFVSFRFVSFSFLSLVVPLQSCTVVTILIHVKMTGAGRYCSEIYENKVGLDPSVG